MRIHDVTDLVRDERASEPGESRTEIERARGNARFGVTFGDVVSARVDASDAKKARGRR